MSNEEIWAVAHGDRSTRQHLVLPAQLLTGQKAKCGATFPFDDASWLMSDDPIPSVRARWQALPKCGNCKRGT